MTTVQKWGNSLGVRIPHNIAEDIGLSEGKQVTVEKSGKTIVVRPLKIPRYSLKKLLKGITPKNINIDKEWLNMKPVGREII